jgi:hypothetical protein
VGIFMLNIQLAIQPQTEQRIRKILNNTQDYEAFAQGIINYQITELLNYKKSGRFSVQNQAFFDNNNHEFSEIGIA